MALSVVSAIKHKIVMYSRILAARAGIVLLGFLFVEAAQGQEASFTARCVSIPNLDDRIECLESKGASLDRPSPDTGRPPPTRVAPSFDCRAAVSSMEQAICADPTLSEWDLRMGQQYQQALRLKRPADAQALLESQRSWILQRNTICGAMAG